MCSKTAVRTQQTCPHALCIGNNMMETSASRRNTALGPWPAHLVSPAGSAPQGVKSHRKARSTSSCSDRKGSSDFSHLQGQKGAYLLLKGLSPGMMWVLSLPARSLMRS